MASPVMRVARRRSSARRRSTSRWITPYGRSDRSSPVPKRTSNPSAGEPGMRSRFTLITPPDPFEPIYYDQSPDTVAVRFRDDVVTAEMQRPGEQRIRLVGGYFSLSGVLGGIGASFALLTLAASLIPKISIHLSTGAVLEAALIGGVTCWANL